LLLNNAGLINHNAPLWEVGAEEFSQVVDVNVKGVANVIRHFVPAMVRRNRGVIVNFSSGWGRSTDAEVAPYCATKWAIEGLTQALAQELPPGMAAVPFNPGIIDTDMLRSCFGDSASGYPAPQEWAKVAAPFLLKLGPADNGRQLTVPIRGALD
jgi:NAD(P)-dependent dehydrogenase (short-subunit alcohol dehydrogenase family)